jgi:hypothetical protein
MNSFQSALNHAKLMTMDVRFHPYALLAVLFSDLAKFTDVGIVFFVRAFVCGHKAIHGRLNGHG